MKRFQRNGRDAGDRAMTGALIPALTVAFLLSGCSADVGRFDFPTFNLNGDTSTTNSIPTPSEPVSGGSLSGAADRSSGGSHGGAYVPPRASRGGDGVEVAALPEPAGPVGGYGHPSHGGASSNSYQPPRATYAPSAAAAPSYSPSQHARTNMSAAAPGESIEVQRGDTIYGLARRHGVTVKDLMAANSLTAANIKPGQRLRIPGGAGTVAAPLESKRTAAAPISAAPRVAAAASETGTAPAGDWGGSYTIRAGDSLFGIARSHKVRVADLQSANNITNPRQLKPGMVLRVPGAGGSSTPTPTLAQAQAPRASETEAPRVIQSTTQPTVINGEKKVAALDTGGVSDATSAPAKSAPDAKQASRPDKTAALSPAQIGAGKLRWPSKGKVISGFGQRPDGTHNDGINIAVPQGTDVHAAEEGEVAYAGSELKGYGNLILVRHDNGWVTAYAHSETMLVKRGDKVRRGDVIAKAGKTGQVDQPQLHFELRQGSKPVDPLPYLDRL